MKREPAKIAGQKQIRKFLTTIRRLHDLLCEWWMNVNTRVYVRKPDTLSVNKDAGYYEYSPYYLLQKMLRRMPSGHDQVFADYGCGKGRVVCLAARRRYKKVVGIEIDPDLAAVAKENAAKLRGRKAPIEIAETDIVRFDCSEVTVIFCFNSFGRKTTEDVLEKLRQSLLTNPRKIIIALFNPLQSEVFESCAWLKRDDRAGFAAITNFEANARPYVEFYESIP